MSPRTSRPEPLDPVPPHQSAARRARWWFGAIAAIYAGIGLCLMVLAAPKVPYADPWRFLASYLEHPFPANVLMADNGHREVLPNLVRFTELQWFGANQWLQIGVGLGLALATLAAWIRALHGAERTARAAAAAISCIGLFWLGNCRKLAHGNESVSMFCVLLCLVLGLRALTARGQAASGRRTWLAAAAGVLATLSFGSGVATFAAFAAVLVVQRAPLRTWLPLAIGAVGAAIALLLAGGGDRAHAEIAPVEQFGQLLRWLGAPFVWACSPLLDPAHAARLPWEFLRAPLGMVANPVAAAFGPPLEARWPGTALGGLGVLWLLVATVRLWRRRDAASHEHFALGIAWFGLAVGGLVVALRLDYFRHHPDQVTSQRYLPWSMLLWTGLWLGFVLREGRSLRMLAVAVLGLALALAPSQVWTGRNAWRLQRTAELTALGAAVGVLDIDYPLVETDPQDLLRAVPLLQAAHASVFAWPETRLLGERPAAQRLVPVELREVTVARVANRFGSPGSRVVFQAASEAHGVLVLLDGAGTACGLVTRLAFEDVWRGWCRGEPSPAELRAAQLR